MPFTLSESFWISKTTWTGIGAIVAALVMAYHHQITWNEAGAAIFTALQTINLRDAIVKSRTVEK